MSDVVDQNIQLPMDCEPGTFYQLGDKFFLPTVKLNQGQVINKSIRLPISCMFDIDFAFISPKPTDLGEAVENVKKAVDGSLNNRVGYLFTSRFTTVNSGATLLTYLNNKGEATESETLIRDDELIVYHYPNKGTMAISPLVNEEIQTIFEEQ